MGYNPRMAGHQDIWLSHALNEIKDVYGVDCFPKAKTLHRSGKSEDIDLSFHLLWNGANTSETLVSGNDIDSISCDNASETSTVRIEGHTIDGNGDLTFVIQTVTLNGQNTVTLPTPLFRAVHLEKADTTGALNFQGIVYVFDDDTTTAGVPDTATKIHLQTAASENRSVKLQTAISSVDYYLITQIYAAGAINTAAGIDVELDVKPAENTVWKTVVELAGHTRGSQILLEPKPFVIVPANHDVRMRAKSDVTNTVVIGGFNGILLSVV